MITLSNEELNKSGSAKVARKTVMMCDVLAFDAAIQHELATINDLCDYGKQEESDARLDDFSVQLTFKDRSIKLGLSCMDTYDAFMRMLDTYLDEIDMYN